MKKLVTLLILLAAPAGASSLAWGNLYATETAALAVTCSGTAGKRVVIAADTKILYGCISGTRQAMGSAAGADIDFDAGGTIEADNTIDITVTGNGGSLGLVADNVNIGGTGSTIALGSGATAHVGWAGALEPSGNNANSFFRLPLHASPPVSPVEGELYSDTSHALCWYSGAAWVVVSGAGSCS